MKIGIYTYYDAVNDGAFLQAYCLKQYLEKKYSADVFFIKIDNPNYRNKLLLPLKTKNPVRRYRFKNMKGNLEKAQMEYFKISESDDFDFVVFGSDEIWNIMNPVFSESNFGTDIECGNIVSYAVSMGQASIDDERWTDLKEYFDKFKKISVRDYNSAEIIKKKIERSCDINLDPVFLSDIPVEKPKITAPYFMVYGGMYDKDLISSIKRFATEKKLKILSVDIYNRWCKTVSSRSPWEFMGYIENAQYVITNMFHGTMLSIIKEKKFITILTSERKNKMMYALERFDCMDRTVEMGSDNIYERIKTVAELEVNHKHIQKTIMEERNKTDRYFDK